MEIISEINKSQNIKDLKLTLLNNDKIKNIMNEEYFFSTTFSEKISLQGISEDKMNGEEIKDIRKLRAGFHTILDLSLFFSNILDGENVIKYFELLKLKKKINEKYLNNLKEIIQKDRKRKTVILLQIFPNISFQAISILSELDSLCELIFYDGKLNENIEIHIFFLNKVLLDKIDQYKGSYLEEYFGADECYVKSFIKLNKWRIVSFIKRYITEYVRKKTNDIHEIDRLVDWIENAFKIIDESVDRKVLKGEPIVIPIPNEEQNKEQKDKEKKEIEVYKERIIQCIKGDQEKANICYYFSNSFEAENVFGFTKELINSWKSQDTPTFIDTLIYIREIEKNNIGSNIIYVQSSKCAILFNLFLDEINDDNKGNHLYIWDYYVPTGDIVPLFLYFGNISKPFNCEETSKFELIYSNSDYTKCILGYYIGQIFNHVINLFELNIKGPTCPRKGCNHIRTIIVQEKCEKCHTTHLIFKCPKCWNPTGDIKDYFWLPMEIYFSLEYIFLNIPYTFILNKRDYKIQIYQESFNNNLDINKLLNEIESNFESNMERFEKQYEFIQEMKNRDLLNSSGSTHSLNKSVETENKKKSRKIKKKEKN